MQCTLRPMTEEEFKSFHTLSRDNYAQDIAKNTQISMEKALEQANKSFDSLLPKGLATENHYCFIVDFQEQAAGHLWYGKNQLGQAYIYDIFIFPEHRGKGLGKAVLIEFENHARQAGFKQMGLHVFGFNKTARNLYLKFGFYDTNFNMAKDII